jgi:tetratricopeptide (TPR) repeat protein
MRSLLWAAGVAAVLAAGPTSANPLDDAKAGMKAFDKGDNPGAVRLFTSALNSHRLVRSDQELAFVKRAEAHIALGQGQAALADAYSALNLDPADNEAIATRDRAQAMLNPPPGRAEAAPAEPSSYQKSQTAYQEALKRYEDQKKADAKHYDEQVAKYDAQVKAEAAARAAQTTVPAVQTPKPAVQAVAQTSKPTVPASTQSSKPVAQPAAQPAVKPKKPPRKPTTLPNERPSFY